MRPVERMCPGGKKDYENEMVWLTALLYGTGLCEEQGTAHFLLQPFLSVYKAQASDTLCEFNLFFLS